MSQLMGGQSNPPAEDRTETGLRQTVCIVCANVREVSNPDSAPVEIHSRKQVSHIPGDLVFR